MKPIDPAMQAAQLALQHRRRHRFPWLFMLSLLANVLLLGLLIVLLAGCTIPNVPANTIGNVVLDGTVAFGPRHWIAVNNVGMFVDDRTLGKNWQTLNPGPDLVLEFRVSDSRVYYDAPTDRFIGVSIGPTPFMGVMISFPDATDWTRQPGYPGIEDSFLFPVPQNLNDQPKLGIGATAILVEAGDSRHLLYCDKASFMAGIANCTDVGGQNTTWSLWMPVHATTGTGDAVYAVRVTADGCGLVIGRGSGPWNAPTWQTQQFPLTNCIDELPSVAQVPGGAQYILRTNGVFGMPVDDAYFTVGNIFALIHDARFGVMQERLFGFSGDWAHLQAGQLCLMQDGNVSLMDGSVAMMNPATFDLGGIMLAAGPEEPLGTVGWMYDTTSQSCILHEIQGGTGALPQNTTIGNATATRAGDFSMCAPDPGTDWGWCLGQASNNGMIESVLTQVCRHYVLFGNGMGTCE